MTDRPVAQILERTRQRRAALAVHLSAGNGQRRTATDVSAAPLAVGARVFDRISGEEGVIVGRTRENIPGSPRER
jgi:hypothetical protein